VLLRFRSVIEESTEYRVARLEQVASK